MTLWEALVLGVVQGATEFLPVSSSGHLVIGQELLDVRIPGVLYEVVVHVATLFSILAVYRMRVGRLLVGMAERSGESWRYAGLLVLATLPAVVVGLLWRREVEALFEVPAAVGVALLVTGGFLWSTRRAMERGEEGRWAPPGAAAALAMGLAQTLAFVPGISRSGTTVVVGLWLGVEPREAAAFSFLMAVPAIGGAAVLQLPQLGGEPTTVGGAALLGGGVAAALTGVVAIRTFVAMLRRRSFHRFAPYCWTVGALFLGWVALR